MPGRRWSDGLHQAIEAKEGVAIERETRTYATITIQNCVEDVREAGGHGRHGRDRGDGVQRHLLPERVPGYPDQNQPCIRTDRNDSIFKARRDKYNAVIQRDRGREQARPARPRRNDERQASEVLARMLKRTGIIHTVLNAKFRQQEAEIVSRAGLPGDIVTDRRPTWQAAAPTSNLGEGVREKGRPLCDRHRKARVARRIEPPAAGPLLRARATPASRSSSCLLRTTSCASSSRETSRRASPENTMKEGEELEHPLLQPLDRVRPEEGRAAELRHPQAPPSVETTLLQPAARGRLWDSKRSHPHATRSKDIIFGAGG